MAWILRREDLIAKHCLLANAEHTVGRRDARIVLDNDQSISRKHATISITFPEGNTSKPTSHPLVMLKDSSKYGTTVNGKKVDEDGVILNSGDAIKFGILENKWRIAYEPFICSSSGLERSDKANVRQQLAKIGGHIVNEWSPTCNLLIMNKLNVSIKVVSALVSQRSIVTCDYLVDLVKALDSDSASPDPKKFVPHFDEPVWIEAGLKQLEPNAQRLSLFKDKTFITFSAKQFKKLEFPIKQAGGSIASPDGVAPSAKLMRHNGTCVLQASSEGPSRHLTTCLEELKMLGKRQILEAEIGLAIIFCSAEKYCNPLDTSDVGKMDNMSMAVSQMSTVESQSQIYTKKSSSKKTTDDSAPTPSISMSVAGSTWPDLFAASRVATQQSSVVPQSLIKEEVEDVEMDDAEDPIQPVSVPHAANESSKNVVLETKEEDMFDVELQDNDPTVPSPPPPVLPTPVLPTLQAYKIVNGSVSRSTLRPLSDSVEQIWHEEKRPLPPAPCVFAGFQSTRNVSPHLKRVKIEVNDEDEVPVKCVIMVSRQIIHLSAKPYQTQSYSGNTKNFKCFKKAIPRYATILHNGANHSRQGEDYLDAGRPIQRHENNVPRKAHENVHPPSSTRNRISVPVPENIPGPSSARKRVEAPSVFRSTQDSCPPDDDSDDGASAFDW